MAVAAARFRVRLAGAVRPHPARPRNLAAIFAPADRPRRWESTELAAERGAVDRVIVGLLFMGGLRRSEAVELEWRDVTDAREGDGLLVAVRRSKTNPDGETADVRFVKGDVARALRALRARRGRADRPLPARGPGPALMHPLIFAGIRSRRTVKGGPKPDQSGGGKLDHPAARWRV